MLREAMEGDPTQEYEALLRWQGTAVNTSPAVSDLRSQMDWAQNGDLELNNLRGGSLEVYG
jgi:hypothetical protein